MPGAHPPAETRRRRTRVLLTGLAGAISLGLLLWIAPLDDVLERIARMHLAWVLAAVGFEVASCLSYVVIFRRFFPEPPRKVSRQVAWTAMGAGAILPGGNISSAAATGWLLRRHGVSTRHLLERCGALLCFLTGFGFAVNGVAGISLLLGLPGGPHDLAHTCGPILVSAVVLGGAAGLMLLARRLGGRAPVVLRALAAGLEGAWDEARRPNWRLLGGAGFLCLDMAALWAACAATGHPLGVPALILGYCIGYLATMIPMPAGLGVLDSGLSGALVLYGLSPAAAVGAVLVYHAISVWIPGTGGLLAWLRVRRLARSRPAMRLPELAPLRLAGEAEA